MEIRRVGLIGTGLMGGGIAQTAAQAGICTMSIDTNPAAIENTKSSINANLDKLVAKGKFTEQFKKEVLSRMAYSDSMEALHDYDIIIEAVPENIEIKKAVYTELEKFIPADTPVFTNTSALSITSLATALKHRDRFMGTHFFSPVPVMKLVELIRGMDTSEATFQTARKLAEILNKVSVLAPDTCGFIANRIIAIFQNEVAYMIPEGFSAEEIDATWKLFVQAPMGPMAAADFSGLEVSLGTFISLFEGLCDERYRPAPYLRKLVAAGKLGPKTGRGFVKW